MSWSYLVLAGFFENILTNS